MNLSKNIFVPHEVYSARLNLEHIPIVEKWFYQDIEFFPSIVRDDPEFARYCLRMGHAYMKNLRDAWLRLSESNISTTMLGDDGFAWKYIPFDDHDVPKELTLVCAGAGTNISFEITIAEQYPGCRLYLLDPSPQAIKYVKSISLPSNIIFVEKGLALTSGSLSFTKPDIPGLGSLSSKNIVRGHETFDLEVTSLGDFMATHSIDAIDYLKFDIEGCEHEVIRSLADLPVLPSQIAFELDQPTPIWTCEKTLKFAMSLGYKLVDIWGTNVLMQLS